MTYIDEPEVRRPSRGTKVLGFGVGILAVLSSFWGIVWFIRSYVEPPRVLRPSPLALASRESKPITLPEPKAAEPIVTGSASSAASAPIEQPPSSGGIADRWASVDQFAPSAPAPAAAPPAPDTTASLPSDPTPAPASASAASSTTTMSAATSLTTNIPDADVIEEVAESSVPAITGPAPLPRRKPVMTASAIKRSAEPPLPRPRPDGPAPQSVFTAVPVADDRFPTQ